MLPWSPASPTHTSQQNIQKPEPEPESAYNLIPSLPDDVALNCLARVPRSHHPTLSLVSKPIRSLLSSPLFFNTRSHLRSTEPLLYLTAYSPDKGLQLFTLLYPNRNVVVPVPPIPCSSWLENAACAVLGPNIYVIGGSYHRNPSSQVWVLDCRFNRWQRGPTMLCARRAPFASVVDGKIYVMGGCHGRIRVEVLDPDVGTWVEVPSPFELEPHACVVVDDKIYVDVENGQVVFDPRNGVWESVENERKLYLGREGDVMVDGILYCCDRSGKIDLFDVRQGEWKELKGLDEDSAKFWGNGADLAYVGGKLLVAWRTGIRWGQKIELCFTEIEVTKNGDAEIWGKVCWSHKIPSIPRSFYVMQCSGVLL